jgi:ankyrin repeat protein
LSMQFFNLCINNKLKEAQEMFGSNIDLGFRDPGGRTALAMSSSRGHLEVIRWLIETGSPLEIGDNDGKTALMKALIQGHLDVAELLVGAGANINAVDRSQRSALTNAIVAKKEESAVFLITRGARIETSDDMKKTPLHYAAQNGMPEAVRLLLEKGSDPTKVDMYGNTPLKYALTSGNRAIVGMLEAAIKTWDGMEPSANKNNSLKNEGSNTESVPDRGAEDSPGKYIEEIPDLQTAIEKRNPSMVKYFIDQGTDVNLPLLHYGKQEMPLMIALSCSDTDEIINLLVNAGADINIRFTDNQGTCDDYMRVAINRRRTSVIKLLLEKGFDITQIPVRENCSYTNDYYMNKMIGSYSFHEEYDTIRELSPLFLDKGVTIDLPVLKNLMGYHISKIGMDICRHIIDKCQDINEVDISGQSILHIALAKCRMVQKKQVNANQDTKNDDELFLELLFEREDLDINLMDYSDCPPLFYACKNTDERIVKKLLHMGAELDVLCGQNSQPLTQVACEANKLDILKLLIDFGADINVANDKGTSLLHTACINANVDLARLLADNGADVSCTDNKGNTPLHMLVRQYKQEVLAIIDILLDKGVDMNAVNNELRTPFFESSLVTRNMACNTLPVLKHLVSKGAIVDTQDKYQNTPLHYAVRDSDPARVRYLLDSGSDSNIQNEKGESPYAIALKKNNRAIISMIEKASVTIAMDGDDLDAAFMRACRNGQRGVAEMLVRSGNIDVTYVDDYGRTPLHYIAGLGMTALAKFCIEHGVDVNYTDTNNQTALHFAAASSQKEVFKLLVNSGADANIADNEGVLPIHFIANRGQHDMLKVLLDSGFPPNTKMNNGASLLHTACYTKGVECVRLILAAGVNPNVLDENGESPLIVAARQNQKEIASLLVKAGADISLQDVDGDQALHIAVIRGFKDMILLMLEFGANINTPNNHGLAPLHIAAYFGYKDIFKLLLDKGADFEAKTGAGLSCIDIAAQNGQKELVEYIGIIQKRRQVQA